MADSTELKPVEFRRFKNETDIDFVDSEDLDLSYLAETTNLTPFRKNGALVQVDGTSIAIAQDDLPDITAFGLTDFIPVFHKYILFDKDEKEVLLVVYRHPSTGQTKFFVDKYYNPKPYESRNNNNPTKAVGWINEWLELTERYNGTLSSVGASNTAVLNSDFGLDNDYLNSYFIVNHNTTRDNRYNYIIDWVKSTKTVTLKGNIAGGGVANDWIANDEITIVKFPVTWLYSAKVNTELQQEGNTFNATPSDFIYIDNALRMPCGKTNPPLILTYIKERSWFLGDNDMQYEGFWFDFQTLPQEQLNSAVTAFGISGGAAVNRYLTNTAGVWTWATAATLLASVLFTLDTGNALKIIIKSWTGSHPPGSCSMVWNNWTQQWEENCSVLASGWSQVNSNMYIYKNPLNFGNPIVTYYVKEGSTIAATDFNYNPYYYIYTVSIAVSANFPAVPANLHKEFQFTNTWSSSDQEFGYNSKAKNFFLDTSFFINQVNSDADWINIKRYKFIMNLVYDNRSELLLAHGTYRPKASDDTSLATGYGAQLRIGLWFSRRLTGLNFFNQKHDNFSTDYRAGGYPALGKTLLTYPYWQYVDGKVNNVDVRSNETKHFSRYSLSDFQRIDKGSMSPYRMKTNTLDISNGTNAFTYDANKAYWYINLDEVNCGWGDDGRGLSYIARTKRFLEQDVTMNYDKGVFVGDTNGRLFIINATNFIENEPLDNSDNTYFNLYATLISQYDIFLRNKFLSVVSKDGDRIKTIENNRSTILYIKESNVYALNTRVQDDTKYYISDTYLGRGGYASLTTPHGTIILANDAPWIVSNDEMAPLMTPENGRLSYYQELIETYQDSALVTYSNFNDELLVKLGSTVFIYSFTYKAWTRMQLVVGMNIKWFSINRAKEITFINEDNPDYNISKFDKASSKFYSADETENDIDWQAKWHKLPLNGRQNDFQPQWVTMNLHAIPDAPNSDGLLVTCEAEDNTATAVANLPLGTGRQEKPLSIISDTSMCNLIVNNLSGNGALTVEITSIILWISTTKRKLGAYQTS